MPRLIRPRLLLLPLVLGMLVAPAFFATSSRPDANDGLHAAGTVCRNIDVRARKPDMPSNKPNCVNCRAPLVNAPLARTAPATLATAAPPAA